MPQALLATFGAPGILDMACDQEFALQRHILATVLVIVLHGVTEERHAKLFSRDRRGEGGWREARRGCDGEATMLRRTHGAARQWKRVRVVLVFMMIKQQRGNGQKRQKAGTSQRSRRDNRGQRCDSAEIMQPKQNNKGTIARQRSRQ